MWRYDLLVQIYGDAQQKLTPAMMLRWARAAKRGAWAARCSAERITTAVRPLFAKGGLFVVGVVGPRGALGHESPKIARHGGGRARRDMSVSNASFHESRRAACASPHRERVSSTHRTPFAHRSSMPWRRRRAGVDSPAQDRDVLGKTASFRRHATRGVRATTLRALQRVGRSKRQCPANLTRWIVGAHDA